MKKRGAIVEKAETWAANVKFAIENEGSQTRTGLRAKGNVCYQIYASTMYGYECDFVVDLDLGEAFRVLGDMHYRNAGLEPLSHRQIEEKWHG